ncbi:hypothetical protein J7K70_00610 [bacterium]|nr:hypothetical protein [bacterium]
MAKIFVINSQGIKEPFSWRKIYYSAQRVGAPKPLARSIATQIQKKAYPGITTREIFKEIKKLLMKERPVSGIRYNLKTAIRHLGPTGFPFEKYIGAIFQTLGFSTQTNQLISGAAVAHYEIDLIAKKFRQLYIGECKFHSIPGNRVDLKVALYVYARFLDIKQGSFYRELAAKKIRFRPIVITNTKFTSLAIRYAEYYKIDLLGWRYPRERGLEYLIESEKLYPVTILPSITGDILSKLASKKIMLIQDLLKPQASKILLKLGVPKNKINVIQSEAQLLMQEEIT